MPVLSVILPDYEALVWKHRARIPDFQHVEMGSYILGVRPKNGGFAFSVDRYRPPRLPETLVSGVLSDMDTAKRAAYDHAIAHARATLAAIGGA